MKGSLHISSANIYTIGLFKRINYFIIYCLISMILLLRGNMIHAEGTKQLMPSSTDNGYIQIFDQNTFTRPFASFNCPEPNRLNIHICNPGEIIYMGFKQTDNNVYFRLKDPSGATVSIPGLTAAATNTYLLPSSGMGYINSYTEAFNGPSAITAGGYNAIAYTSTMAGDYYIEFNPNSPTAPTAVKRVFTYFDLTVASPANVAINGRVWSRTWDFTTNNGPNQFKAIMYVYADDGIITALNFNGMQPFGFSMSCNSTGCTDTANPATDRVSRFGNTTYPQYKIFLNDPDPNCFVAGSFGDLIGSPTITGCPGNFCINLTVDKPGSISVLLDLDGNPGYNPGTADRQILADVVAGLNCIPWDGKDGLGNKVATGITLPIQVDYFNGLTHLPLFDVEDNQNGYIVTLAHPTGPSPKLFWDDTPINTGVVQDAKVNLTGCGLATGCHKWKNRGNNSNPETINTWWYANIKNTSIPFPFSYVDVDADTRNLGRGSSNDTTVCGLNQPLQLAGGVYGVPTGTWSSTGNGTFSPTPTSLNAKYIPSATDLSNGKVIIKLTSSSASCAIVVDSISVTFSKPPKANAGADVTTCSNIASVTLNGGFTNSTGAKWIGLGTFVPNISTMNVSYTPTTNEINTGTANIALFTTGNGVCPSDTDRAVITIDHAPVVNAGIDTTICESSSTLKLYGTATGATTKGWTGGAGTFNPGRTTVNANYTPTATEISNGSISLTLTADKSGCTQVTDQLTLNIKKLPTVNAGADQTVCKNAATVTLSGSATNYTNIVWSGGSGTFSPNKNTLNAVYTPTTSEINSGSVTLTLTANTVVCPSATDQVKINFAATPTANVGVVGKTLTVCGNNPAVNLNGVVTGATGGSWSGGCGTYIPGSGNLSTKYIPCNTEVSMGIASLVLTTTGTLNNCTPASDTLIIIIQSSPLANAGVDKTVCANNPSVSLTGTASNASTFVWSLGNGSYNPNPGTLNITYTPSATEISNGSATLVLTATRPTCLPTTDTMKITITPAPIVNAGVDQSVCHNNSTVTLNGSLTGTATTTWSGGSGTFSNVNSLNSTYKPTLTERNNGSVTLTLKATGTGCTVVSDQMKITITPAPTANANIDQSICKNNATATLDGSVTVATGGTWSGGGTFSPNANDLGAIYTPSAAEIASKKATLTLTTTGIGNCLAVTDNMVVTITPAPTANAGANQNICVDAPEVNLAGSVTVATGGIWSGGLGTFTPNSSDLNAQYTPTPEEINGSSITLTLTTSNNGNCNPVSKSMQISIAQLPVVNAGGDLTICGSANSIQLSGKVQNATGGTWTTTGSGSFNPNANKLNAKYVPSATDKTNGSVTLTLTSIGNGLCQQQQDDLLVTFTEIPTINAGPNSITCANDLPIQLNAAGSNSVWSGGAGTFSPDANAHNATYTPTTGEITSGSVTLTVTTIADGACPVVTDKVKITIPKAPLANAGIDKTMCGNSASISLTGTISNSTGGFWNTSGTGSFSPDPNTKITTYVPSSIDKTAGSVILSLSTTGNTQCTGHTDSMILTIQPEVVVNAGADQILCDDKTSISLSGTISNGTIKNWASTGTGSFTPNNSSLNTSYNFTTADKTSGVTLTLTSNASGACPQLTDDVAFTFTPAPKITPGTNQTICADSSKIILTSSATIASGVLWTSNGTGTFTPDNATFNTTYIPSAADQSRSSLIFGIQTTGNGTCNAVNGQITVTITPAPTVNAGADMVICEDIGSIQLNATKTIASGVKWLTSGTGTFDNINLLNAKYTPSATDILNATVTLTIETTGNGDCKSVKDQIIITINPAPLVDAGPDQNICANSSASITGTIQHATGGKWMSSGTGSFQPNDATLNAVYFPSTADTTIGTVTLTLSSSGNGNCVIHQDQAIINFKKVPIANAGPDQNICADSFAVKLIGKITNAGGGSWSTSGSGNFYSDNTALTGNYVPSISDRSSGSITLTLESTTNGPCPIVKDSMKININAAPTVQAGNDQTICADSSYIQLSGSFTNASGIKWRSSGDGSFSNDLFLTPKYFPSANDKLAGNVNISLTTTGNGTCHPISDNLVLNIVPLPTANAGADLTICADQTSINLNGSVTSSPGGTWTTTGNGVFGANNQILNSIYYPGTSDTTAGQVTLTLTTKSNGYCKTYADNILIRFDKKPIVNAGTDQTACANTSGVSLSGIASNTLGVTWASTTGGIFSPNPNVLNPSYKPSNADTSAHSVTLTITASSKGVCPSTSDQVVINFNPVPLVNAGPDQIVCSDISGVQLQANFLHTTGINWSTNGTGAFSPDNQSLSPIYFESGSDTTAGSIIMTLSSTAGICAPVSDNAIITFTPAPTVNAGPDVTICVGAGSVHLEGIVTVATGGHWISNGTGSFADENSLSTDYIPSAADEASGSVTLILETTGNGACNFYTDIIKINFSTPVIKAGNDTTVCDNGLPFQLNGSGSTGIWSGGLGTFTPNANALNAKYTPSTSEIAAHSVTLTLTTTGMGSCTPSSDQVTINILNGPTVTVGPDQQICTNTPSINLTGNITVASGGTWTSSGSGSFGDKFSPNTNYIPSASDYSAGAITLTLTSSGNGSCTASKNKLNVTVQQGPTVNAGLDKIICENGTAQLSATFANASGIKWSGYSGGFNSNDTDPNAIYTPSAGETSGTLTLIATTTGPSICPVSTDDIKITFAKSPKANAGGTQNVCASNFTIQLSGTATNATGGKWSTVSGTGTFSPSEFDLNAKYIPSTADTAAHSVGLRLSTTGNGVCSANTNDLTITFTPVAIVNAGADDTICTKNTSIALNGAIANSSGGTWSTFGTGTFIPDATTLNTSYRQSQLDVNNGAVNLKLTSNINGPCPAISDYSTVYFTNSPVAIVNAGFDKTVCADLSAVPLDGFIQYASGGTWQSNGSGSFKPNNTDLHALYVPSLNDTTNHVVTISLTSAPGGVCATETDDMILTITPAPIVSATVPSPICADAVSVNFIGNVVNATGGTWTTSGSGTFSPDATTKNATYTPSITDKSNGAVGFTFTTTGIGTCKAVTTNKTLTITKTPTVNAGIDQNVCASALAVNLSGKLTVATGGTWTSSGGGTFSPVNSLNTIYTPGLPGDTLAKVVNLTLTTTTGLGTCKPVNDQVKITFVPIPKVNAGPDVTICASTSSVILSGKVINAAGGKWTTSGSGIFSEPDKLITNYTPSEDDKKNGSVTLTLFSTGNSNCSPANDQVTIKIQALPIVNTGAAKICKVALGAQLNGVVNLASGGTWSSSGTGTFSTTPTDLQATYIPSATDISAQKITLTLTSEGNGVCAATTQSAELTIDPLPIADAGQDQSICIGSSTTLTASTNADLSYVWSTTNGVNIGQSPLQKVTANKDTSFVLRVFDTKGCSTTDTVNVRVYQLPTFSIAPSFCLTNKLLIDATPAIMPAVPGIFQWYKNGQVISGQNISLINPIQSGNYMIVYAYGNCFASGTTIVNAPPVLTHSNHIACENASLDITMNSNESGTYAWETGQNGLDLKTISVSIPADTTFISATVTNGAGCSATDSIRLIGIPTPILSLDNFSSCIGLDSTLHGKPSNIINIDSLNATYTWYKDDIKLVENQDSLEVKSTGEYKIVVAIDQCIAKDSATVTFNPVPVIDLPETAIFCKERDNSIIVDAKSDISNSYLWTTPTGVTLDSNNTHSTTIRTQGTYSVSVTNAFNCSSIDSIFVKDVCPPRLFVPNAITPDMPGEDQVLKVFGAYFTNYKMEIFSRWGEVIFMSTDREKSWDGKYLGSPMPVGVYNWVITYEGEDPEARGPFKLEGTVTVIR